MNKKANFAFWGAAITLAVITVACGCGYIASERASPVIYGITGLIVLWYTRETSLMRREQEKFAAERSTPRLAVFVEARKPKNVDPRQPENTEFLFVLENLTPIHARLLVHVRSRTPSGLISPAGGEYSAKVVWELQPKEKLQGHFPVAAFAGGFGELPSTQEAYERVVEEAPLDVSIGRLRSERCSAVLMATGIPPRVAPKNVDPRDLAPRPTRVVFLRATSLRCCHPQPPRGPRGGGCSPAEEIDLSFFGRLFSKAVAATAPVSGTPESRGSLPPREVRGPTEGDALLDRLRQKRPDRARDEFFLDLCREQSP